MNIFEYIQNNIQVQPELGRNVELINWLLGNIDVIKAREMLFIGAAKMYIQEYFRYSDWNAIKTSKHLEMVAAEQMAYIF